MTALEGTMIETRKNPYRPDHDSYQRALAAEPGLSTAARVVAALEALARPDDEMCYGCAWELIVKPIVAPLVGWGRGYPATDQADDLPADWKPGDQRPLVFKTVDDFVAGHRDERVPPANDTEAWLRTSDAFDAVTDVLLYRLWEADPGNGCGIRSASHQPSPA